MKFTLFQGLFVLVCALMVLSTGVHAQDTPAQDTPAQDTPAQDTPAQDTNAQEICQLFEIFCDESDVQLDNDFDTMFDQLQIPTDDPDADTTPAPARRRSYPVMVKRSIIGDVKSYFKTYWEALGKIFKGEFAEGIFLQMKNSGSWCEKNNWVVKAVKAGIDKLTKGAISGICDCLYPMVKQYESFDKLKADVGNSGLTQVLSKCPDNLRKQIQNSLKKNGGTTKTGGKA
ncbi:hypothetical protein BKA57DRAFT_510585 [Linnemannia elongata]|nr:hypothetical protein BKA57DRAFT_510585 [Linnemannia elongata]